jgi:WD40 repeat protein
MSNRSTPITKVNRSVLTTTAIAAAALMLAACSSRNSVQTELEPTRTLPPKAAAPAATATPPPAVAAAPAVRPITGLTRDNVAALEKLYTRSEALPRNIYTVVDDRVGLFSNRLFEVFDVDTLQSIKQTAVEVVNPDSTYWYALSADARYGAIMEASGKVDIYDLDLGKRTKTLTIPAVSRGSAADIALNADGSDAVIVANGKVTRFNVASGKEVGRSRPLADDAVFAVFVRDGSRVAALRGDGVIDIVETRTGKTVTLDGAIEELTLLSFSPDGMRFSTSNRSKVWVWDSVTGKEIWSFAELSAPVSVAFPPAGDVIVIYGEDGGAVMYDITKREPGQEIALSSGGAIRSVQFSVDGKTLYAEGAGLLERFDVENGSRLATLRRFAATQLQFTPDNQLLTWSDRYENGELASLNASDGKTEVSMLHTQPIRRALLSRTGKYVASSTADRAVSVWRMQDGSKALDIREGAGPRGILCLSPDESTLAYFENGAVIVREIESSNTRKRFKAPFEELLGLTYCDNAKGYVAFQNEKNIEVMTLDGRTVSTIDMGAAITDSAQLEMSVDGRYIAGLVKSKVLVWDIATGKKISSLALEDNRAQFQFSTNSDRLVISSGDRTELLDVQTGKSVALDVPGNHLIALSFPPDGRIIVTTSRILDPDQPFLGNEPNFTRGEITVWDAATGRALRQIKLDDPVYSSALSPDGTRLATTGYDGSVTVWGVK